LAPELKQYDAAIAAQDRGLTSAKRSHYLPIVAMQAEVKHHFLESGEGVDAEFPMNLLLTYPDENDWDVGIRASLPLYAGGSRKAAVLRAQETLAQLKAEEGAVREKIEQRIRSYVLAARASNEVIEQTRQAAEAARKTLDLAADAYAQGLVSIVELLDAQTAYVVADELAGNALYDFLINLMEAQRASSTFTFFMSADERKAFYERLDAFYVQAGVKK
jgi:outer membrane protein